ncbi:MULTISPECIES: putative ABC transporter permease subunit YbbP [Providencia]|uniref:ABC transporter permease n=2 Tax=Providencia TaxID=586 RepID=A0AA42FSP1_9GAMM|nr:MULTISPECIES: putative ABC transporter permease subunit YbbP [Providencia]HCI97644.1 ABC transporter permease [Providencia sp.]EIL1982945.1 ABC transporter permease [Providencia rettgeri]EIU9515527.1 ABC transporter permease [Providencia rettgeri]EJD6042543.1 ABC transporter permease [Providencia rettgeri]EJD6399181.1 ABC transporter permease [Providencia rettgeri]
MIWRWFWREWKTPSLLIVWLALTLAVACVLALGRISDRIENSMSYQSRELLAGDLVLRSSHPADPKWLQEAKNTGLQLSQQISFSTMAYATEDEDARPQLVLVKAADNAYPLYGGLVTEPEGLQPRQGQVLVAPRLLELLGLKVGDSLDIGDATLKISGKLLQEPDSGFNPFQIAPRVLIAIEDAPLTGAIQLGSRLTYRDMFAGDTDMVSSFQQKFDQQLRSDQRWYTLSENNGAVGKTFQRAQQFLLLSVLLTLLLAIAAVVVSMTHYCRSRHQLIAVLKTLGAGRNALRKWIIGQWLVILIAAALLGSLLGLAFEGILMQILGAMLPKELPSASLMPWVWAVGTLFIIAIIVGSRPYYQLMATQPSRVLRDDAQSPVWPLYYYLPIVVFIVVGGLFIFAGVNPLLWSILAGIVVVAILLALIGWLGLWGLRHIKFRQLSLRLSVSRLLRQPLQTITQMSAFSLSFMLLALLILVRGDLLDRWQQQLPADSPNYFLINMNHSQLEPVTKLLAQYQVKPTEFNPVVLARLTDINDQSAIEWADERDPNNNTVRRELSLTWQSELAPANVVDEGTWPPKAGEVSIEQTVVKELGLKIGDKLTFNAGAQVFSATVSSIRTVDWESLRPNFYFIFSEETLSAMPATWLSSFHYEGDGQLLTQLSRQYPTINVLDTGAIITQIQQILQQVSQALEVMVVLVIFCGILLLLAQIQVGMSQRERELVVYRTLGASKKLMRRTLWSEFALLGLMAGLAAAFGAEIALWLLQSKVFDFPWQPEWRMWVLLPLSAALLLSICGGWLGLRLVGTGNQHRRLPNS